MKITKNNYEEYFLLYVDDELNAPERLLVEAFVQEYPFYAAALELFFQTKMPGDDSIVFISKECLLKTDLNEIGIDNYEEYFLLLADNELTKEEEEETERFVLQHPHLQQEFTSIRRARLTPEPVVFNNKNVLYHKQRQIVTTFLFRAGMAASVCVAVALTWLLAPSVHQKETAFNPNNAGVKKHAKQLPPQIILPGSNNPETTTENEVAKEEKQTPTKRQVSKKEKYAEKRGSEIIVKLPRNISIETIPPTETAMVIKEPETIATVHAEVLKPLEEVKETTSELATALSLSDNGVAAQPAVYQELNTNDNNQSLYVGSLQLNKAKVNGFLKSASRLLGSKIKQNTN